MTWGRGADSEDDNRTMHAVLTGKGDGLGNVNSAILQSQASERYVEPVKGWWRLLISGAARVGRPQGL